MTPSQFLLAALFISAGCAVNSAIGFGAGIFATPLLVWIDIPLPGAIAIAMSATLVQSAWGCWLSRGNIPWSQAWLMHALRLALLGPGVLLLGLLVAGGPQRVKHGLGVVLLVVLTSMLALKVKPQPRVAVGWTLLAGTFSGLLNGMLGMGGPFAVLWAVAHDWPAGRVRSFLWSAFVLTIPPQLLLLWLRFGEPVAQGVLTGLILIPAALIGAAFGHKAGLLLSADRLRRVTYGFVFIIAVRSILA